MTTDSGPGEESTDAVPPAPAPAPTSGRKTTREAAEERRQAKLELVREQVETGSLVIRAMTDEERERYPPRAERPNPRKPGSR